MSFPDKNAIEVLKTQAVEALRLLNTEDDISIKERPVDYWKNMLLAMTLSPFVTCALLYVFGK